jgi:hypothetical protein
MVGEQFGHLVLLALDVKYNPQGGFFAGRGRQMAKRVAHFLGEGVKGDVVIGSVGRKLLDFAFGGEFIPIAMLAVGVFQAVAVAFVGIDQGLESLDAAFFRHFVDDCLFRHR